MTNKEYAEVQLRNSAKAIGLKDQKVVDKLVKIFMDTLPEQPKKALTEPQQRVFDYLVSGKPVISLSQLAQATDFDHPTKLNTAISALVVKGYLVPGSDK